MPKHIRNKLIFVSLLTLVALLYAAGGFQRLMPKSWADKMPGQGLRLGLDLQGGMHLVLKVNLQKAIQTQLAMALTEARETLRSSHFVSPPAETVGPNRMRLRFKDRDTAESAMGILKNELSTLGLVRETNSAATDIEVGFADAEVRNIQNRSVEQCLEILRNRIDQFGVTEPLIVRQGQDEIIVQLPGLKDPKRAVELIGRTAQLEFKLVDASAGTNLSGLIQEAIAGGRLKPNYTHAQLNAALRGQIPAGDAVYIQKRTDPDTHLVSFTPILLRNQTLMTGDVLRSARVEIGGTFNEPHVSLTFNPRGARIFEKITRENVGHQLAIVLDDVVRSAPVIQEAISGGQAQISGSFTTEEASDLAIVLRAGALPAPVDIVQNLTVGPSLGLDSIHKGLHATILGTLLVVFFMLFIYRFSGVIASSALMLNLVFMMAALSLLQATLTLPGLAGIVLSIGMAVDTNVLIYERMREELALKQTLRSAVDNGYANALWTIVDSHVTTLITAVALFLFGTGPIKGFAITLSLGIIFNLFTALYATKGVYDSLTFNRRLKRLSFLQLFKTPTIDFIAMRKAAFLFSGVMVLVGIVAVVQIERGKANLGVDLAGGTLLQFRSPKPIDLEPIRAALDRNHIVGYELQDVPSENILIVRVKHTEQTTGTVANKVTEVLARELPQQHLTIESKADVGASVSKDLKHAAFIATLISLVGFIVYLAWRFDRRFGLAAAVATFHDILAVLGLFYILDKEITLLVVTALLTLAGYSLTDTVVVFDRIRENMGRGGRRQNLAEVFNRSINEVLGRTVITSFTVFLVLLALLWLGGPLLRDFSLALLAGVIVGTYSSIFVASPIVYIWSPSDKTRVKSPKKARTSKRAEA
jgi:SecD/SecF fusion protein